jgi:hypothetical protein
MRVPITHESLTPSLICTAHTLRNCTTVRLGTPHAAPCHFSITRTEFLRQKSFALFTENCTIPDDVTSYPYSSVNSVLAAGLKTSQSWFYSRLRGRFLSSPSGLERIWAPLASYSMYTGNSAAIKRSRRYIFFCGDGPRSRSYRRTAALRRLVQPCDDDYD